MEDWRDAPEPWRCYKCGAEVLSVDRCPACGRKPWKNKEKKKSGGTAAKQNEPEKKEPFFAPLTCPYPECRTPITNETTKCPNCDHSLVKGPHTDIKEKDDDE